MFLKEVNLKRLIYLWLHWIFIAVPGHSLGSAALRLLTAVPSLAAEHRLQGVQAQQLCCMDLAAPLHVESFWARDQTHVACIGKRIL